MQNGWTIVHSNQWRMHDLLSLHRHQHLVWSLFFILPFLLWFQFACLSWLMMLNSFCGCICHQYIFWSEMSVSVFCPFLTGLFDFFYLSNFDSSLYILDTASLLNMELSNIFSNSTTYLFSLLTGSFTEQSFWCPWGPVYQFFPLWIMHFTSSLRSICLTVNSKDFFSCFFLKVL